MSITDEQATKILTRLIAVFNNNIFNGEFGKIAFEEWHKRIKCLEFDIANKAVDKTIEKSSFFPAIADFISIYNSLKPKQEQQQNTNCILCKGYGLIVHKRNKNLLAKAINLYNEEMTKRIFPKGVESASYCVCEAGEKYKNAFTSILEFYSIDELNAIKNKKYDIEKDEINDIEKQRIKKLISNIKNTETKQIINY